MTPCQAPPITLDPYLRTMAPPWIHQIMEPPWIHQIMELPWIHLGSGSPLTANSRAPHPTPPSTTCLPPPSHTCVPGCRPPVRHAHMHADTHTHTHSCTHSHEPSSPPPHTRAHTCTRTQMDARTHKGHNTACYVPASCPPPPPLPPPPQAPPPPTCPCAWTCTCHRCGGGGWALPCVHARHLVHVGVRGRQVAPDGLAAGQVACFIPLLHIATPRTHTHLHHHQL